MDKWFIVVMVGNRMVPVLGPFDTREEADAAFARVKYRVYDAVGPYSEWRYTWATALIRDGDKYQGRLNHLLHEEPAEERIVCYRHG